MKINPKWMSWTTLHSFVFINSKMFMDIQHVVMTHKKGASILQLQENNGNIKIGKYAYRNDKWYFKVLIDDHLHVSTFGYVVGLPQEQLTF